MWSGSLNNSSLGTMEFVGSDTWSGIWIVSIMHPYYDNLIEAVSLYCIPSQLRSALDTRNPTFQTGYHKICLQPVRNPSTC